LENTKFQKKKGKKLDGLADWTGALSTAMGVLQKKKKGKREAWK